MFPIFFALFLADGRISTSQSCPKLLDDLRHAALRSGICGGMPFDERNIQDSVPECIVASALSFNFWATYSGCGEGKTG
jgi:hypothetical protein